jgi:beta-galactosidase
VRARLLLTLVFFAGFGTVARGQGPRQHLLMDKDWKFSLTDTTGADGAAFYDHGWRVLDLPHDWSIENDFVQGAATGGGGGYLPTGVGWYRKHFVLGGRDIGKTIWIEFEGVYQNSDVWINGHHLGHYPNGYMSFYYDLSPFVKRGGNILSVRVDNSRQPNTRFYSGSGIYRHVWLNIANPLHIAQWGTYITTPMVDSAAATVSVKTRIEGGGAGVLRSIVLDAKGHEAGRSESSFTNAAHDTGEVAQTITINSPALWSLENPELYELVSVILVNGKIMDEFHSAFGVRDIRYDVNKGFLLNGVPVKMNGVCLHHDAGSVGAAVPEAVWARRLSLLKAMGCNAIRTSHNPVAPALLDLCDRMGFLVMDEIFDEWKSAKVKYGNSNYFDEWSQHDVTAFVHRDRNHPSVVMWSAGNEIGEQKQEKGVDVLRPLIEAFHREDPTRPVTTGNDNIAADNGMATLPFLNMLDIVGYNYVDRWHERRELYYSIDRHDHPDWKMVGTESVSIPGIRGNYYGGVFSGIDSSVVRPANMGAVIRAEQLWKFVAVHDYVIGDFMWTGIDYLGEARWPSKNASSGVMDLCGFPKDAYYFYQSQWTDKPMIHLFPHWNWKGREGQVIPVMVYTNCDSVELFLNGRSLGIKALEFPRQGNSGGWNKYARPLAGATTGDLHLSWDVAYEPGLLRAVGRKGGKEVCEEEVRTAGMAAGIRLSMERYGGGYEVAQVKIEILDKDGNLVPDAANSVQLTIEGGTLLGLDNGNPVDHTSMKSSRRNVFNGLALAIVQSAAKKGFVQVRAESAGLAGAVMKIDPEQAMQSAK